MKPSSQAIVCAKTLTLLIVVATLLISTTAAISPYSRSVEDGKYTAINEHPFNRIPTRYFGRFRSGNSDVLSRYLSSS
ncbi:hypothetical protein Tcan_06396 [Toxocara canis]|uniref:Uncharacterized protein n=1 Tax=Toxocara canis TaxID=6265 RepID=A0A0B2VWR5_TOXCA|nr:hypothetical protein Tcan_06396 [Toxocara canis]